VRSSIASRGRQQNISEVVDKTSTTSVHGLAVAPGELNPAFNCAVGSISVIGVLALQNW
jgi:hypothetical protein